MTEELSFELAGGPYAVTAARLALADVESRLDPSMAFDVRLLVSELVTNSVKHAGIGPEESITMRVRVLDEGVRIEVSDAGGGFEQPDEPSADSDSGWGLFIVEQLATQWGVEHPDGDEPYVWFEIRRARDEADDPNGEPTSPSVAA
jgi:two-component sensor histidine kinase